MYEIVVSQLRVRKRIALYLYFLNFSDVQSRVRALKASTSIEDGLGPR
jgi:hypothetical protein